MCVRIPFRRFDTNIVFAAVFLTPLIAAIHAKLAVRAEVRTRAAHVHALQAHHTINAQIARAAGTAKPFKIIVAVFSGGTQFIVFRRANLAIRATLLKLPIVALGTASAALTNLFVELKTIIAKSAAMYCVNTASASAAMRGVSTLDTQAAVIAKRGVHRTIPAHSTVLALQFVLAIVARLAAKPTDDRTAHTGAAGLANTIRIQILAL